MRRMASTIAVTALVLGGTAAPRGYTAAKAKSPPCTHPHNVAGRAAFANGRNPRIALRYPTRPPTAQQHSAQFDLPRVHLADPGVQSVPHWWSDERPMSTNEEATEADNAVNSRVARIGQPADPRVGLQGH